MHDVHRPWNRRPSTRVLAVAGVVGLTALAATAALALDGTGDGGTVSVQLASSDDASTSTVDDHGGDRPDGGHGADDVTATTVTTAPPTTTPPPATAPPPTTAPVPSTPPTTTAPATTPSPPTVDDHSGDRPDGGHGADDGPGDDRGGSTTTPPTTTLPAATSPGEVLDRGGAGGSISVAWDSTTLTLVDVRPTEGWTAEVHHRTGREVSVRFESGDRETRVELEVEDGGVRDRVEER